MLVDFYNSDSQCKYASSHQLVRRFLTTIFLSNRCSATGHF